MRGTVAGAIAIVALTACAAGGSTPADRMLGPGQPPAFREGFNAGCESGLAAFGDMTRRFEKDPVRFESEPLYRQGWGDGFTQCKERAEAVERVIR